MSECNENPPVTSVAQVSSISDRDFMPLLPRFRSKFKEGADFSTSKARLRKLFSIHLELTRCLAGVLISISEFETKIALAHALYIHSEYAQVLRERLWELKLSERDLNIRCPWSYNVSRFLRECGHGSSFIQAYREVLAKIGDDQDLYVREAEPLLDAPSLRIFKRFSIEWSETLNWVELACAAYKEISNPDSQLVEAVCNAYDKKENFYYVLEDTGRSNITREVCCARDARFSTFTHTRDYDLDESKTDYERELIELLRVQRDEIDAIETFANVLFDLQDSAHDIIFLLARFVEDEARHAEAGHTAIAELGLNPFSLACSVIGINVRAPMPPELAFAQINVFGELNIVSRLNIMAQKALAAEDVKIARTFDFIHADELTHVRKGRDLLKRFAGRDGVNNLEEKARRAAAKRLAEEGVVGEEYALSLSRQKIFDIMGE